MKRKSLQSLLKCVTMKFVLNVSFIVCVISSITNVFASNGRSWIAMDPSKSLPNGCHVGGYEESENFKGPLYIARAQIENELVIGKVIDPWKSGYFPKDGGEHWKDRYEVLCGGKVYWIPKWENHEKLIAGGRAGNGVPFYICRGIFNGQISPGKFYKPTGCCYVSSYGKEHCVQDFSILRDR